MSQPHVIVFSGYGLNSELETLQGFLEQGATGEIVHINDIIDGHKQLQDYQIMAFPGGFAYGDDTGAGNAYANRVKNNIWDQVYEFTQKDKLVIGICNGAQILANTGLVPAIDDKYGERQVALRHNATARYECRWVDLLINPKNNCIWTQNIEHVHIVVSHGEGNLYATDGIMDQIRANQQIVAQYAKQTAGSKPDTPDFQLAKGEFPYNPNGALEDIAALSDPSGRLLLIMPHPERAMYFTQLDNWPLLKEQCLRQGKELPEHAPAMQIFKNAVQYFS